MGDRPHQLPGPLRLSRMPDAPSKNQVKKAGSALRKFLRGDTSDTDAAWEAIQVVQRHRAAHQRPPAHANNGVRSMSRTVHCPGRVTQRLKRMSTILDKLQREPTLALDRMQDVGGCRVVLTSLADLWRLRDRILKVHPEAVESDYVNSPRRSGYRAVHLIVEYGPGDPKPIEIQLRTLPMHSWAMMVETYSGATGTNYKRDGGTDFQTMATLLSQILALDETGHIVPRDLLDQYNGLRMQIFPPGRS